MQLPKAFLERLTQNTLTADTLALGLCGSFARGQGTRYSDVDIHNYLHSIPENAHTYTLCLEEGLLVSRSLTTLEEKYAALKRPQDAIWIIPALRQTQILYDPGGNLAGLISAARQFNWASLKNAAEEYASNELAGFAEEVFKVLGGLHEQDEAKTMVAVWGLIKGMPNILLVRCGIMIPTENAFYDLAQQTAGTNSNWSHAFREALGLDTPADQSPPFLQRGSAGLRLYRETATLMCSFLQPSDKIVIEHTLDLISEADY